MRGSSVGIRVSVVLTILGSVATLLLAGTMLRALFFPLPQSQGPLKFLLVAIALFFAGVSAWGLVTAVGVFHRRPWSRLSMMIFAVLLVGMGGSALLAMLFVKVPDSPDVSPQAMHYARVGVAVFYAAITGLGAWWLLLFNSPQTKWYFDEPPGPAADGRPLSISLIAWYLLLGAAGTGFAGIVQVPGLFFGEVVTGWTALVLYTAYTAVEIYLGAGLLRRLELARVASITFFGVLAANSIVTAILPGFASRMEAVMDGLPQFLRAGRSISALEGSADLMLISSLLFAVPVWFLIRRRSEFR